jgi:LPS-assembly protein
VLFRSLAQRYQFRQQQLTVDGTPSTRQLSDLLLFGAGSPWPHWRLDTTIQYNTDVGQAVRSIVSARYQPQPYHTLAASYRYARDLSEQVEIGWQWPVWRRHTAASGGERCSGTLYGVGRVNYSVKDRRTTESLYGMEYDAGCWILRVVVQRESTAANESNLRRMLQLELVGLSRLGSNPLQVLKDNIPGYRLLRDEAPTPGATPSTVNP